MATESIQPYNSARVNYLASYLQSLLPGLNKQVATTWITAEKGVNGNVIGLTSGTQANVYPGQTGSWYNAPTNQWIAIFPSQEAGLRAAANLIQTQPRYSKFVGTLPSGNASSQASALSTSGWNNGYYAGVFKSLISATNSSAAGPAPNGGASTPLTVSPTTTNPPTSGLLGSIPANTIIDASTVGTIVKGIQGLTGGTGQYAPDTATLTTIVAKYIGKPWNSDTQLNISKDVQNAIPANSPLNGAIATNPFLGAVSTVAGAGGIPDVQTAVVFVGIILVGIAFLGVGGLIALRKK